MKFKELAELFEKLGSTSKRLEKILLLRDFYLSNEPETVALVFDMMTGTYQKEIDKKSIGISLKTIFAVISFLSKKEQSVIEKEFNKKGDVGIVATTFLSGSKQKSLTSSNLKLEDINSTLDKISATKGANSNMIKRELLTKLFLSATDSLEQKFLARLS